MLTNQIITVELITGMTNQEEPLDVVCVDLSKAFDSVGPRLLIMKIAAMEIHLKKTFLRTELFEKTWLYPGCPVLATGGSLP